MPQARTIRGGLKQSELWLRATFPLPFPVRVQMRKLAKTKEGHQVYGLFNRIGPRFAISLHHPQTWDEAIESLHHEWSHLCCWTPAWEGNEFSHEHPDEWGLWRARIYRRWVDEGGYLDAREFSPRPYK